MAKQQKLESDKLKLQKKRLEERNYDIQKRHIKATENADRKKMQDRELAEKKAALEEEINHKLKLASKNKQAHLNQMSQSRQMQYIREDEDSEENASPKVGRPKSSHMLSQSAFVGTRKGTTDNFYSNEEVEI